MEENNDEQNEAVLAHVSLPQDIQQTVLAFLTGRVVLKLRPVCRSWRDCIQEPNFVNRHLNNALCLHQSIVFFTSVDDDLFCMYTFDPITMKCKGLHFILSYRFQMSDPCNGLVCVYDSKGPVEVLNPTTMKHVTLPLSELQPQALFSEYFLGSVQSTNNYKVVCICHRVRFLTYEVCTVGTQSWRAVRESADFLKTTKAVTVSDAMHWLLLDVESNFTRRILLFNLTDETFSETAVPDAIKDHNLELFEGEGKLHLLAMPGKGSASEVSEIWVSNSTCTVWDHMRNISFQLPVGMRPHFLHKNKFFYGNQRRFYYIDLLQGGDGFHINVKSDECIVSSGIFVDSLLLHSMTGLVDSMTLLRRSRFGSSSSGAAKSNKKMKWRLTPISAKKN